MERNESTEINPHISSVQSSPVTQSESLNSDTNYLELVQTPEVKGLDPQDCLRCKS